jgi:hypothetical protein
VNVVGQTFRDPGVPGIEFLQADLSLMREAERVGALLPAETLDLVLFTTAIYALVERRQIPGIVRLGRRVLVRSDELLDGLDQKRSPSLKERGAMSGNIRRHLAAAGMWTSTSCSLREIGIVNGAS